MSDDSRLPAYWSELLSASENYHSLGLAPSSEKTAFQTSEEEIIGLHCPSCGAPVNPNQATCSYCGIYLSHQKFDSQQLQTSQNSLPMSGSYSPLGMYATVMSSAPVTMEDLWSPLKVMPDLAHDCVVVTTKGGATVRLPRQIIEDGHIEVIEEAIRRAASGKPVDPQEIQRNLAANRKEVAETIDRSLWKSFYPKIKEANMPSAAFSKPSGLSRIWRALRKDYKLLPSRSKS